MKTLIRFYQELCLQRRLSIEGVANVQSSFVLESIIDKFNLIEYYKSKNIEEALESLQNYTSIEITDEGTIAIDVNVETGWFHLDDDEIYAWCENNRVSCFRGSLDDVLGRYYGASQAFDCDAIVRITADCPVIDPTIIDELINFHAAGNYDYSSLSGEYPDGLDCCIFSKEALASSHVNATHQYEREHVMPYFYKNLDESQVYKYKNENYSDDFKIKLAIDVKGDASHSPQPV